MASAHGQEQGQVRRLRDGRRLHGRGVPRMSGAQGDEGLHRRRLQESGREVRAMRQEEQRPLPFQRNGIPHRRQGGRYDILPRSRALASRSGARQSGREGPSGRGDRPQMLQQIGREARRRAAHRGFRRREGVLQMLHAGGRLHHGLSGRVGGRVLLLRQARTGISDEGRTAEARREGRPVPSPSARRSSNRYFFILVSEASSMRSPGEWAPTIVGPIDMACIPGCFRFTALASRPPWVDVNIGSFPKTSR